MPSRASLGERDRPRRTLVALAAATAIHVAGFALLRYQPRPPAEEAVRSETITLAVRTPAPTPSPTPVASPTPTPTPPPRTTPTPTPPPVVTPPPKATPNPFLAVRDPAPPAAAKPAHRLGGAAKVIVRVASPAPTAAPVVVTTSAATAPATGIASRGTGSGGGPGAGDGGLAGTGTGVSGAGKGTGALAATAPCGDVDLIPHEATFLRDGTLHLVVEVEIRLRDGNVEDGTFPYPFVFKGEAQNPFEHESALVNGGVPVQLPPPGTDMSGAPVAVRTVLQHTDAVGHATLPSCGDDGVANTETRS